MSKFDKQIVCVNTKDLLHKDYFQGFAPASAKHYWQRIMDSMHARRRGDVEEDPTVKQVIGYAMVVHMPTKTVLAYQRSTDATKYTETRAYGNWSWGVGGHMEMVDTGADPVTASLRRELAEEIGLEDGYELEILGFINDDRDALGKVHFGVLYLIKVGSQDIKPADGEMSHAEFLTVDELSALIAAKTAKIDGWSEIALEPLAHVFAGKTVRPKSF